MEEYIQNTFEGKCAVEGYVKPSSSKIIRYSSGIIERGSNVVFELVSYVFTFKLKPTEVF
jgi:hypothetical protein